MSGPRALIDLHCHTDASPRLAGESALVRSTSEDQAAERDYPKRDEREGQEQLL